MSEGLEPCNSVDRDEALTSIAISLKRIADAHERFLALAINTLTPAAEGKPQT